MTTETTEEKPDRWGRDAEGYTPKERLFIAEIQRDWNGTQAAIRAGYSEASAKDIAYELLRKPKIIDKICAAMAKRSQRAEVDAAWVLARLVEVEGEAASAEKGNRLHRLRALELIGKHVDVNAFRTQLGIGNPDGTPLDNRWDFSRLDDEEFETLGRLLRKCAVGGIGPPSLDAMGEGAGEASPEG